VPVWCQDEAGPYQAIPQAGASWQPEERPACQPHEYIRGGTATLLTLFHPATGLVRVKGVTSAPNVVLHPWLQAELEDILTTLPPSPPPLPADHPLPQYWRHWLGRPDDAPLPPVQLILIWDNLVGHTSADLMCWLARHGVLPLYTPCRGPGSIWPSLCSASSSGAPLRDRSPRRPTTSSPGWRRRRRAGTRSPPRSCGMGNGGSAAVARGHAALAGPLLSSINSS